MSARNRSGFTIAEVLVAVVMLAVGVMAMVGSSAMVTRMVGGGRHNTLATQVMAARADRMRQIAASTTPACTSPLWKTDSAVTGPNGAIAEKWEILANPAGVSNNSRPVRISLRYRAARRIAYDTTVTRILCK